MSVPGDIAVPRNPFGGAVDPRAKDWEQDEVEVEKVEKVERATQWDVVRPTREQLALQVVDEQFKRLHTALELSPQRRKGFLIGVTSAVFGEGKTTVSARLAMMMANNMDQRVMLLDGDLRKPELHQKLALPSGRGYVDMLERNDCEALSAFRTANMENLLILPAGNPAINPGKLIRSPEMRLMLDEIRESCDFGIVDLPPVLPVADTRMFASKLDAVVVVARAHVTPRELVAQAISTLGEERVLGVVLNGQKMSMPRWLHRLLFMG